MDKVPRKRMRVAAALTEARASFVSLVDHGANQVPFNVVKMADLSSVSNGEDGQAGTPLFKGLEVNTMAGKDTVDVHKITFDKAKFPDEDAVKAFLKEAGRSGEVIEDGDTFVVKSKDLSDDTELLSINGEDGVTYGVLKSSDEDSEDTETKSADTDETTDNDAGEEPDHETVAKSFLNGDMTQAEVVQKYDAWWASYSEGKDIATVLEAGVDGLPIGIYELNDAFYTALRNNLLEGDYTGARGVVIEFGELIIRLAQALEAAVVAPSEDVSKAILGGPSEATDDEATDGQDEAPTDEDVEKSTDTEEASEDADDATEETKSATDEADDTATDDVDGSDNDASDGTNDADLATQIGKAVAIAVADAVKPLQSSIETVGKQTSDSLGQMEIQLTKTTERVDGLERRSQTRKGADVDEVDTDPPTRKEPVSKGPDRLVANTLGFRSRN